MSEANNSSSDSIGFVGLLTILFIALKLTHYIDWQWRWVLAPVWISATLVIGIVIIAVCVLFIIERLG